MGYVVLANKAAADAMAAAIDASAGRPSTGVHVGGGRHVDMSLPSKPGWTITECQVVTAADGTACVALTPLAAQQDGKVPVVAGKPVPINVKTAVPALPAKFVPPPPVAVVTKPAAPGAPVTPTK